ncbi:sensor histidine kinase [Paenibacillus humicola]|uniref:sensor histidine kinase n=1 Tax=Paenibacillus humicola TaxID=3110540 RepID=UPI00237C08F2|nr:GHKL domain-containing protein [Paenibacillus humicola]
MHRNIWMLSIVLAAILLAANNTVYYFTTKRSLEERLRHELRSVANQIEVSIELSRTGAEKYEEQIGRELRSASVAAEYALPPDLESITPGQLEELKNKLDLKDITLLKRTKDSIVLDKSSDPNEVGLRTNGWKPWFEAFTQLFDHKNVTIGWGQSLPYFWSGPFEFAASDPSAVNKWGYYYDGTTDYMIDPYVGYKDRQRSYDEETGVSRLIQRSLESNSSLLEIGVINPKTFPNGGPVTVNSKGQKIVHKAQKPIISGSNAFAHPADAADVKRAIETNRNVWLNTTINGKHVIKLYIPVQIEKSASLIDENGVPIDRYVLTLVADYQTIQDTLDRQFVNIAVIMAAVTALSLLIVFAAAVSFRKSRDKLARRAQETYVEEINQMFQSIRAQRHDFLNHVQTIHSLAGLGKIQELQQYTAELTGDIRQTNEMINIGNPAIAALIRSKISQAEQLKIRLSTGFSDLGRLSLGVKSLDLTRLLGNLIDNAFDEVAALPEEERRISVEGRQRPGYQEFRVSNVCRDLKKLEGKPLFDTGYSTKNGAHSGLGLSIVKSIVDHYKGTVRMEFDEPDTVTFVIRIPD